MHKIILKGSKVFKNAIISVDEIFEKVVELKSKDIRNYKLKNTTKTLALQQTPIC